jgi:hypothetical protein
MLIRTKGNEYRGDNSSVLFEFLGVKTMNSEGEYQ